MLPPLAAAAAAAERACAAADLLLFKPGPSDPTITLTQLHLKYRQLLLEFRQFYQFLLLQL